MTSRPALDSIALLGALVHARVDFVLVGRVAGAAHGSAYGTTDLAIAVAPGSANDARLARVLTEIGGSPEDSPTSMPTAFGTLTVHRFHTRRYVGLVADATAVPIGGNSVRVASLDHLIAIAEESGRPADVLLAMEYRQLSDQLRAP